MSETRKKKKRKKPTKTQNKHTQNNNKKNQQKKPKLKYSLALSFPGKEEIQVSQKERPDLKSILQQTYENTNAEKYNT